MLGFHPDEATEALVDAAIAHQRPFAVVPCCVFSRLFGVRTVGGVPVRSTEHLCAFLAAKHPAIQLEQLPFAGKNTVVYMLDYAVDVHVR